MALPQDFWQNEHMFHRFRSKPCQRLLRSGICDWHSQCQFSHDAEWPRRPPSKYGYSPAMCPHIRPVMNNCGEFSLENSCPNGLSCTFAHTKDEVLYHPSVFKTSLCEEHHSLTTDQRSARRSKHRPRCHRYYCPFAHGKQELRTTPMSPEQCEAVVRAAGIFPHAACCDICSNNCLGPGCMDHQAVMGYGSTMGQEASMPRSQFWPGSDQPMLSQMVVPGGAPETTSSEITGGHLVVWGAMHAAQPWLQQPTSMQQQAGNQNPATEAGNQNSATEAMQKCSRVKETPLQEEQTQHDDDADGDLDIDSEIIGRAVRFIEELSTEDSGEEDPLPRGKQDKFIETALGPSNGVYRAMWNPQEALETRPLTNVASAPAVPLWGGYGNW